MYTVYVIYNKGADKFYIGQTQNMIDRLKYHDDKEFKNSYTSRFVGSWELVYKEVYNSRQEALKREKQLKSFRGREFVRGKIKPK